MSKLLYRLGHASFKHRKRVLAGWLGAFVLIGVLAGAVGGSTSDAFSIPGTESQRAADLLEARFPAESGSNARVVFASQDGTPLDEGSNAAAVRATIEAVTAAPDVVGVSDPFGAGTLSPEKTVAYATVQYATPSQEVDKSSVEALFATADVGEAAGVEVEFGGQVADRLREEPGHTSELIGITVAIVVLLVSFGSVIAMGLPLLTAIVGVGIALTAITVLAGFVDVPGTTTILATMIGLAVGIDYALFIVTRHRQNMAEGFSVEESAARANATAGGAVVFAGITVVIALAGLAVVGVPFLTWLGAGAAMAVVIGISIAVTLIPAMLGFAGPNIDRWKIGKNRTGGHEEAKATLSARWAKRVTEHPGIALAGGLAVMLVLAVPMLDLRLGMSDAGTQPPAATQRKAYDLLSEGFGPGFNGPLVLVTDLTGSTDPQAAITALSDAVGADPGVLAVGRANVNEAGDTAIIPIIPRTGPSSEATENLVHHLRDDVVPTIDDATGARALVAGGTAANIDISDKMAGALPIFMTLVIGLTLLLLLAVFRSVIVPIKAAIAILLSIASSFGVLVAIFQWGWFKGVVGLQETVPIISFLPVMMFAILFGLSMDYEVFIMSRIREDYIRTGKARQSVLTGLTSSARVITAAALIMISVFASFVLGDDPVIKMFGIGLSTAVFLDATIVRMMIVPAVMALLDKKAWYLPAWLDKALPDLDIEGEHLIASLDGRHSGDGSSDHDSSSDSDDGEGGAADSDRVLALQSSN